MLINVSFFIMNYYILVNKENRLNKDYVPEDLVITDENENNFHNYINPNLKPSINKKVFYYFNKMKKDALKYNINIIIDSGYRSYEYQNELYNNIVKEKGLLHAQKYVALPGSSEHQTGLAIDIAYIRNGKYIDDINEYDEEIKWLINNSYKYGFILRYPKGKEEITGFNFEPWHYRYVGKDLAKEINNKNITLEEYYINKYNI